MSKLPQTLFCTDAYAPPKRYEAFRESMGFMFDLEKPETKGPDFEARIETHLLGDCALVRTDTVGHEWSRPATKVGRDGIDHYLVQFYLDGKKYLKTGDQGIVDDKHLMVIDTAQPYEAVTSDFANVTLVVPRRLLAKHLESPDAHATRVLAKRAPLARIAHDAVRSLWRNVQNLSPQEAALALTPTLELVAAALNGRPSDTPKGVMAVNWMLRQKIRAHIEQELHKPSFAPAELQAHFAMSRSRLYGLFESEGGIAKLIRVARLNRSLRMLVDPGRKSYGITKIAEDCGFCDPNSFGRAFKRRFSMTPSDARNVGAYFVTDIGKGTDSGDRLWEDWIQSL